MNHGIHLAVMDVVFKKKVPAEVTNMDGEGDINYDDSLSDVSQDEAMSENDSFVDSSNSEDDETIDIENEVTEKFTSTMTRMRKIIMIFKLSPVSNNILQGIIEQKIGKKLQLQLDVRTRWNSLVTSIIRFLRVIDSVEEALAHKSIRKEMLWTERDTEYLKVNFYIK